MLVCCFNEAAIGSSHRLCPYLLTMMERMRVRSREECLALHLCGGDEERGGGGHDVDTAQEDLVNVTIF